MANKCDKCKTTDAPHYYPVTYPEADGTTTTHYGCDQCVDDMWDMAAARKEYGPFERVTFTPVQSDPLDYENHHDTTQSW
jgi:hypothetical protein